MYSSPSTAPFNQASFSSFESIPSKIHKPARQSMVKQRTCADQRLRLKVMTGRYLYSVFPLLFVMLQVIRSDQLTIDI